MADDITKRGLSAAQVSRICKVSERTVKNWCSSKARSDPFQRNRRGGRYYWDPEPLFTWLEKQGKSEEAARLEGFIQSRKGGNKKKKARDKVDDEVAQEEKRRKKAEREQNRQANLKDLKEPVNQKKQPQDDSGADVGASEAGTQGGQASDSGGQEGAQSEMNLFMVRDVTGKVYKKALNRLASANASNVHSEFKNVTSIADTLRRLEMDCLETDRKLERVIPVSMARRFLGDVVSRVRIDMMAMKERLAEPLAAMDDIEQIREFLGTEVDNALRHVSRDLSEAGSQHKDEDNS